MKIKVGTLKLLIRERLQSLNEAQSQLYKPDPNQKDPVYTRDVVFKGREYGSGKKYSDEKYWIETGRGELGDVQNSGDPYTYVSLGSGKLRVVSAPDPKRSVIGKEFSKEPKAKSKEIEPEKKGKGPAEATQEECGPNSLSSLNAAVSSIRSDIRSYASKRKLLRLEWKADIADKAASTSSTGLSKSGEEQKKKTHSILVTDTSMHANVGQIKKYHGNDPELLAFANEVNDLVSERDSILQELNEVIFQAQNAFDLYVDCDEHDRAKDAWSSILSITVGDKSFPEVLHHPKHSKDRADELSGMLAKATGGDYRLVLRPLGEMQIELRKILGIDPA